jgi:hypothetical protein
MSMQSVPHAGRLADEILARLEEEAQLAPPVWQPDRWQVRLTGRHPGDREGVARIALARSTPPPALGPAQVGRHLTDAEASVLGRPRQRGPERR